MLKVCMRDKRIMPDFDAGVGSFNHPHSQATASSNKEIVDKVVNYTCAVSSLGKSHAFLSFSATLSRSRLTMIAPRWDGNFTEPFEPTWCSVSPFESQRIL